MQWIRDQVRHQLNQVIASHTQSSTAVATDTPRQMSAAGIEMLSNFEGFKQQAYRCPAQVWTIGFGTTVYPNGKRVQGGDQCTYEQALVYKAADLKKFEHVVTQTVQVSLTQNQFDALVSLTYNIGPQAFRNSTLVKKLNASDYVGAAAQFLVWNKAGGQVLQGLVNRRQREKKLFERK